MLVNSTSDQLKEHLRKVGCNRSVEQDMGTDRRTEKEKESLNCQLKTLFPLRFFFWLVSIEVLMERIKPCFILFRTKTNRGTGIELLLEVQGLIWFK